MPATDMNGEEHNEAKKIIAHLDFQAWQAAKTINLILGEGYVQVPPIPKGYEEYAQYWWSNQLP